MNNVTNIRPAESVTALTIFKEFSKDFTPSCFQQDLLESTVTDFEAWRKTLIFWFGNDYKPQSIQKMLKYYEELKNGTNQTNGFGRKQTPGEIIANRSYR